MSVLIQRAASASSVALMIIYILSVIRNSTHSLSASTAVKRATLLEIVLRTREDSTEREDAASDVAQLGTFSETALCGMPKQAKGLLPCRMTKSSDFDYLFVQSKA